jgi:hypothetical protein
MKGILSRYAQTEDGKLIIDVFTELPEYLYNNFDRQAPYAKKDLDQDFVEYLIGSAREIGKNPFIIRVDMPSPIPEKTASRIRNSIASYFTYLKAAEQGDMRKVLRTSVVFLLTGLGLLVLSVVAHQRFLPPESLAGRVMSEGLTVAAWVSLWEALANFLIHWPPHNKELKVYDRLASAAVIFQKVG